MYNKGRKKRGRHFSAVVLGIIFVLCICVLPFGGFLVSAHEPASEQNMTYTCYKSYLIESGDTLWDIAAETMKEGNLPISEYVQIIKELNGLNTDEIQSGEYLILPY